DAAADVAGADEEGLHLDSGREAFPFKPARASSSGIRPWRRTRMGEAAASMTVDSPPGVSPPSSTRSAEDPKALRTSAPSSRAGLPEGLALVVAHGTAERAMTRLKTAWSGTRIAKVSCPGERSCRPASVGRRTMVRAPGQKRAARASA